MLKPYFIFSFLLSTIAVQAQDFTLTPSQVETSRSQAEDLVTNYETSLNNLGDSLTTAQEKAYFVADILENIFEGEDVLIFNDLDPGNAESKDLTARVYLNNIITKFYKGLSVTFSDIKISKPFYLGENSFFIKVELASNLEGVHIEQPIDSFEAIDLYLRYDIDALFNISQPSIYSITNHRENLAQFTPVAVDQGAGMEEFTFINPGKRHKFRRGKTYLLEWETASPNTPVRLELYRGDELEFVINPVVVGGKFRWDIPRKMDLGKNYRIRIINLKNKKNQKDSPPFKIKRKFPLGIKIAILSGVVAGAAYYYYTEEHEDPSKANALPTPPLPPKD